MPGALIERPKMTRAMYQALKRHIMHEREKKKQEQEQDEALERLKKERELRKKKEKEDSLTLEQTKEQIAHLGRKLESLKQEKHELFSQLKKVLHQEDESKKRAQQREQSEMLTLQQQYVPGVGVSNHPLFLQSSMLRPSNKYLNPIPQQALAVDGVKRGRSPSPTPGGTPSMYAGFAGGSAKYGQQPPYTSAAKPESYGQHQKPPSGPYPAQSTHVTYVTQSAHTYQPQQQQPATSYPASQSASGSKYAAGQSAFTSYPNHYAHQQKSITDHYTQQAYPVQRLSTPQQPGESRLRYLNSPHTGSSIPLQQQLEHANQKSGFSEDKFKIQQHVRGLPGHLASQSTASSTTPKGGIVSGYPVVRTQAPTGAYQTPTSQGSHASPPGAPRHAYSGQQQTRYY